MASTGASVGTGAATGAAAGSVIGPWGTAIGAAVGAIGGAVAAWLGNKGSDEAAAILEKARDANGQINMPVLQSMAVKELGPTQYEQLQADSQFKDAQRTAVSKLREGVNDKGMSAVDRANLNTSLDAAGRQGAAQRKSTVNNFRARGSQGSGAELAAQLAAGSDDAENGQAAALGTAASASQRYWQNVRDLNSTGAADDQLDWNQRAGAAGAADERARWNQTNGQQVQEYNNGLAQQNYENQVGSYQRDYNAAQDIANLKKGKAAQTQATVAGAAGAIGQGINNYFAYSNRK
jgi:hypothetical protein